MKLMKLFRSTKFIVAVIGITLSFMALPLLAGESLKLVANQNVCMVTNAYFGKKQIPVTVAGKTYFGCCEGCKKTLSEDSAARTAKDPVSGKAIDKAKAVIAARADNSVIYFESKATFQEYQKAIVGKGEVR